MSADDDRIDDELREQLHRELAGRGVPSSAAHVLPTLAPSLRRAYRVRVATMAGATALTLGALAGAAVVVRSGDARPVATSTDDGRPIDPVDDADDVVPSTTEQAAAAPNDRNGDTEHDDAPEPSESGDDHHGVPGADDPGDDSGVGEPGDGHEVEGSDDVDEPTDEIPSSATVPRTVDPEPSTTTVPGVSSPATTSTTTTSEPATTPTTTEPPPAPTTFDSPCGSVLADTGSNPVDIIQVVPAAGYRYTLEDPDHGSITVQFTGTGEDCEVRVSPSGSSGT